LGHLLLLVLLLLRQLRSAVVWEKGAECGMDGTQSDALQADKDAHTEVL
jgi:hypothetical protein